MLYKTMHEVFFSFGAHDHAWRSGSARRSGVHTWVPQACTHI